MQRGNTNGLGDATKMDKMSYSKVLPYLIIRAVSELDRGTAPPVTNRSNWVWLCLALASSN